MSSHIASVRTYMVVYVLLLILLALTIVAAAFPHRELGLPIALSIAFAKTILIVLFFMHVRESDSLTKFLVTVGLLWLLLLIGFTMSDVATRPRPEIPSPTANAGDTKVALD